MTRTRITLPKNIWVKVATNVTFGFVDILNENAAFYKYDFVATGEPAPTNDDTAVYMHGRQEQISSDASIDVYLKSEKYDGIVIIST